MAILSGIKSIQRGTISLASVASNTATITSVNTAKSLLSFLGFTNSSITTFGDSMTNLVLTNGTTVTATRGSNTGTVAISFEVVEYY